MWSPDWSDSGRVHLVRWGQHRLLCRGLASREAGGPAPACDQWAVCVSHTTDPLQLYSFINC